MCCQVDPDVRPSTEMLKQHAFFSLAARYVFEEQDLVLDMFPQHVTYQDTMYSQYLCRGEEIGPLAVRAKAARAEKRRKEAEENGDGDGYSYNGESYIVLAIIGW